MSKGTAIKRRDDERAEGGRVLPISGEKTLLVKSDRFGDCEWMERNCEVVHDPTAAKEA